MQENSALGRAMAMVRDLRKRCSWDRIQTRETLRPYLIEEVHELDYAIGSGNPAAIRNEVADLLLHLAWQLVLAEEASEFTAEDTAGDLEAKMKRRHPHLFDLGPREKWETLKRQERQRQGAAPGVLDGLPPSLPDLLMAQRLQERAAGVGFDWPDTAGPAAKIREELAEAEAELAGSARDRERIEHEIGDLLFSVVNLARKSGVHPGPAMARANERFRRRFGVVERLAAERGIDIHTAGLTELDRLWEEAKAESGGESPA
ncbi:MAG TPA: nucleoside triphosphate pyrophosphohydrolase [Gemmatimonadales bacterium]|nr:nucleoside triphosphate pyrophosphohydrolase [Gemmatimonadales bacterium]